MQTIQPRSHAFLPITKTQGWYAIHWMRHPTNPFIYVHTISQGWYAIPGAHADAFEALVQQTWPELFERNPDLMLQLVTMVCLFVTSFVLTCSLIRVFLLDP